MGNGTRSTHERRPTNQALRIAGRAANAQIGFVDASLPKLRTVVARIRRSSRCRFISSAPFSAVYDGFCRSRSGGKSRRFKALAAPPFSPCTKTVKTVENGRRFFDDRL
jgi:hypothetical protein